MSESSASSLDVGRLPSRGRAPSRWRPLLALGVRTTVRGITPAFAVLAALGTVALAAALASKLAEGERREAVKYVPLLASSALAWGAGFLLAFGSALRALVRDRDEGIRQLIVARARHAGYLWARLGGLGALLLGVVAGGTLAVSAVSVMFARGTDHGDTFRAALGALAYALAFSIVLAPVAFALLGRRSRGGGYLAFVLVVLVPATLVELLAGRIADPVREVLSLPSALAALRSAFLRGPVDVLRALRALCSLGSMFAVALFVAREQSRRVANDQSRSLSK